MNRPMMIGLTGPTGAGKSTAAKAFEALGAGVIDCDRLGRELLDTEPCRKALCEAYGTVILDETGRISRPKLAEQAFARAGGSERLNQITHPLIIEEVLQQAKAYEEAGVKAVIVDAALLFESGASSLCDKTIAVTADEDIRLHRVMQRDGITKEQAEARMRAQKPAEFYKERSDFCLDVGGESEGLFQQAEKLFCLLMEG